MADQTLFYLGMAIAEQSRGRKFNDEQAQEAFHKIAQDIGKKVFSDPYSGRYDAIDRIVSDHYRCGMLWERKDGGNTIYMYDTSNAYTISVNESEDPEKYRELAKQFWRVIDETNNL